MKIRTGFVSNSSTTSFVIAKVFMTKLQNLKFSEWLSTHNRNFDGYINEDENYFFGTIDHHQNIEDIRIYLKSIKVDLNKTASEDC